MNSIPSDPVAENSVLSLLMHNGQIYRVADRLRADDFLSFENQTIYSAILAVDSSGGKIEVNSVHSACSKINREWDNWSLIRELKAQGRYETVHSENLERYSDRVVEKSLQRQYLAALQRTQDGITSGDMGDVDVDVFVDSQLRDLGDQATRREAQITTLAMDEYETLTKPIATISSGYSEVDKYTNGLCAPDLFVLTGESGTGKTTLAMNMVWNLAKRDNVAAIFSMEMSRKQLTQRLIASEGRLNLKDVQANRDSIQNKAAEAYTRIVNNGCLYIDDHSSRTVAEIKSQALKVKHQTGRLDVIVVDYLTRMTPEDSRVNRNEQVGAMSRGLKSVAKQLDCCVLCLAQLNRTNDIRDSGEVNHEADVILNLKRSVERPNVCEATVKKSRHAEPGQFMLTFEGQYNRFENFIGDVNEQYRGVVY